MREKAAVTVLGSPEEIERRFNSPELKPDFVDGGDVTVTFVAAPGDRGTEIHAEVGSEPRGGRVGELVQKVAGAHPRAKVADELRRFKQLVETGVITRSDGTPEGELAERKFKGRPAQPLAESETDKAEV